MLPKVSLAQVDTQTLSCCLEELYSEGYETESDVNYTVTLTNAQPLAAYATALGDAHYNPRADFDLNGVIDGDDRDAFFVAYATSRCPADFNCDDALDPDDLGDFTNCYFAEVGTTGSCPSADYNADGTVDSDDLGDYVNAYFAGC